MQFLIAKALHIIFVVSWFAGLFYIVRLFIYHVEASEKEEPDKSILMNQYKIMQKKLWYIITWPAMVLTIITGFWVAAPYLSSLSSYPWLMLKLGLVALLVLYHLQCGKIFTNLKKDNIKYSSILLRLWNEVATLLLVAIVFVIVLKSHLSWHWGVVGLAILALIFFLVIRKYNQKKQDKNQQEEASN